MDLLLFPFFVLAVAPACSLAGSFLRSSARPFARQPASSGISLTWELSGEE